MNDFLAVLKENLEQAILVDPTTKSISYDIHPVYNAHCTRRSPDSWLITVLNTVNSQIVYLNYSDGEVTGEIPGGSSSPELYNVLTNVPEGPPAQFSSWEIADPSNFSTNLLLFPVCEYLEGTTPPVTSSNITNIVFDETGTSDYIIIDSFGTGSLINYDLSLSWSLGISALTTVSPYPGITDAPGSYYRPEFASIDFTFTSGTSIPVGANFGFKLRVEFDNRAPGYIQFFLRHNP